MTLHSHLPLKRTILACSAAWVHRGEVKLLLQAHSPTVLLPSNSKLSHIFPAAGSEMTTLLSAPKTFIVLQDLTQSHRKPRSTLSQHLLIWLNATKTETKAYFLKVPTLITTAPAFPRQLSGTSDNPAFVYKTWCLKGQENISVKLHFWRWLLSYESGNHEVTPKCTEDKQWKLPLNTEQKRQKNAWERTVSRTEKEHIGQLRLLGNPEKEKRSVFLMLMHRDYKERVWLSLDIILTTSQLWFYSFYHFLWCTLAGHVK